LGEWVLDLVLLLLVHGHVHRGFAQSILFRRGSARRAPQLNLNKTAKAALLAYSLSSLAFFAYFCILVAQMVHGMLPTYPKSSAICGR
jgi:hypothetical protein